MHHPTILITAAAGNTGYPTAIRLLDAGYPVRAMVHRRGQRADRLRERGADVVTGSLDDIDAVRAAVHGVVRAYFCPPLLPGLLDKATIFATAAEDEGVEFVVAMSQWLADPTHLSIHTRQCWLAETTLGRMRGTTTALINPGWFADNYLAAPELITQFGVLPLPLGNGLNAPPSNEDIAAVVAAMLADPARHAGQTYRPTGPDLMSPHDIAHACAVAVGRPVRYLDLPVKAFPRVSRSLGLPDYTAAQLLHYFADYQRNAFGHGAPTTAVADLTGRPAEDFTTVARRYLSATARRTPATRLRAAGRMFRGLLRGKATTAVIATTDDFDLTHARLSADSTLWRATHGPAVLVQ